MYKEVNAGLTLNNKISQAVNLDFVENLTYIWVKPFMAHRFCLCWLFNMQCNHIKSPFTSESAIWVARVALYILKLSSNLYCCLYFLWFSHTAGSSLTEGYVNDTPFPPPHMDNNPIKSTRKLAFFFFLFPVFWTWRQTYSKLSLQWPSLNSFLTLFKWPSVHRMEHNVKTINLIGG